MNRGCVCVCVICELWSLFFDVPNNFALCLRTHTHTRWHRKARVYGVITFNHLNKKIEFIITSRTGSCLRTVFQFLVLCVCAYTALDPVLIFLVFLPSLFPLLCLVLPNWSSSSSNLILQSVCVCVRVCVELDRWPQTLLGAIVLTWSSSSIVSINQSEISLILQGQQLTGLSSLFHHFLWFGWSSKSSI